MKKLKIAISGASGFVGRHLIDALVSQGHSVVALSRKMRSDENRDNLTWVTCDLFSRKDARMALFNCDIGFYLTHSMIPSARMSQGNFADYDLVLADNFARSAKINGLQQIIYLGGIIPDHYSLSKHLLSRLEVESTLTASGVPLTALRAGIILGPEGASFRMMYNLVQRLPVMICPSWTGTLSNPVSIWDMIDALIYCTRNESVYHRHFDVGGKTTVSYLEMMRILGKKLGRKRLLIVVPFFSPVFSRLWVAKVTGAPKILVYPLIGSLKTHMVPNIHHLLPSAVGKKMSYGESIDRILHERKGLGKTPSAFRYTGIDCGKSVRSIQRLETLYGFNAEEVAELYFRWLGKIPLMKIYYAEEYVGIHFRGFSRPLISLRKDIAMSSTDYNLFYIGEGYLSEGSGRGRLIFRTIIDGRNTMIEIHEFIPRLPWYVYKYTQAIAHFFTVKMFNLYLLRLQKNGDEKIRIKGLQNRS